jgi:hypothetical protein
MYAILLFMQSIARGLYLSCTTTRRHLISISAVMTCRAGRGRGRMYVSNGEEPPQPGGTLLIEESMPPVIVSHRKMIIKIIAGIMVALILFPVIGSSIDLLSRISSIKNGENHENCDEIYLTSMYVEKCENALFLTDILKKPASFAIRLSNQTTVHSFLQYCLEYITDYTIRFHYYPHIMIIKDKKGLKSFYIDTHSIPISDLVKLIHFIEK